MTKGEEFIIRYQIEREKDWNAQGIFRCNQYLEGEAHCKQQCQECNQYYVKKLNEK